MKTIDTVDPALIEFLEDIPQEFSEITRENLAMVRKASEERLDQRPRGGDTRARKTTIETENGLLDLYIYRSVNSKPDQPCLLWLHGGGFIMGCGEDNWFGPLFAECCECTVVSVAYRLAPEHPFPAGINDSFAALNWVYNNHNTLSIDQNRIAVGGASAGAGLAAGLTLMNRDQNGPNLIFQLLLYPMLDNLHATISGQITDHPVWNRASSLNAWEMYMNGTPENHASQYAASARAGDLSELPPAYVPVGSVDLFVDECTDYVERLNSAGVPAQLKVYPGVYHGAEISGADTLIAKNMSEEYIDALVDAFKAPR
ncbi:MAG: alpha/beta hydrolase [Paracoccaceae bacterium]|jgi:acetyl esterase/lipase